MERWFVAAGKQKLGPFSRSQLEDMARTGQLQAEQMILQEGTPRWTPAATLPDLFQARAEPVVATRTQPVPEPAAQALAPAPSESPPQPVARRIPASFLPRKKPATPDQAKEVFQSMLQMVMQSNLAILQQDTNTADMIKTRSRLLCEQSQGFLEEDDQLFLNVLRMFISVSTAMVHAVKKSQQGDFERVIHHCRLGWQECQEGLEACARLGEKVAIHEIPDPTVRELPYYFLGCAEVFRGMETATQAEDAGYRGDMRHHINLLGQTVHFYREAVNILAPCEAEGFVMMRVSWAAAADSLESRANNRAARFDPRDQYLVPQGRKVFIIHGHDENNWRGLHKLLQEEWGLEAIVLRETVNLSRTVIDKFLDLANECGYALALMTPDDFVAKEEQVYHQARPNVVFELGWFFGRYGPARISIVKQKSTLLPSDLHGILCLEFQESIRECMGQLRNELRNVKLID